MRLAKAHLDVALFTNRRDEMLTFWQQEVGLPFEETLPTGGGNHQHRHGLNGSVFKLNHRRDELPDNAPTGYRELLIAREGQAQRKDLVDPDGNRVALLAPGENGISGIGLRVCVRDVEAHARFYTEALQLERVDRMSFRCGDSLLFLDHDPQAGADSSIEGRGFRYVTIQVFDCDAQHERILQAGGREGAPPRTLGKVARFSMVRDPDGNWIEISQRASLTGSLEVPPRATLDRSRERD